MGVDNGYYSGDDGYTEDILTTYEPEVFGEDSWGDWMNTTIDLPDLPNDVFGGDTWGDRDNTPTSIINQTGLSSDTSDLLGSIFNTAGSLWKGLGSQGQQILGNAALGLVGGAMQSRQDANNAAATAARDQQLYENQLKIAKEIRQIDNAEWAKRRNLTGLDSSRNLNASDFGVKFGGG